MFDVVFTGIREGQEKRVVRVRLQALFKASPEQIDALLSRPHFVLKSGVDEDRARQYKMAVEAAGGLCSVELQHIPVDLPDGPVDATPTARSSAASVQPEGAASPVSCVPTQEFQARLQRLQGASASDVKRMFFFNMLRRMMTSPAGDEDISRFDPAMGETAFWGRVLFYPDDPLVKNSISEAAYEQLTKEAGRITDATVDRIFGAIRAGDSDVVADSVSLLVERFNLSKDSRVLSALKTWVQGPEDPQLLQAIEGYLAHGEGSAGGSAPFTPAAGEAARPQFEKLLSMGPMLLAAIGAVAFFAFREMEVTWVGVTLGVVLTNVAFLLWCYGEHESGRLTVFWCPADAIMSLSVPPLALVLAVVGWFWTSLSLWFYVGAILLLAYSFNQSFKISAKTNWTITGVLTSFAAKLSLSFVSVFALVFWLVVSMGKPDRREGESGRSYDRRVQEHERNATLQGLATAAAIGGSAVLLTRHGDNSVPLPYDRHHSTAAATIAAASGLVIAGAFMFMLHDGFLSSYKVPVDAADRLSAELGQTAVTPVRLTVSVPPDRMTVLQRYRQMWEQKPAVEWKASDSVRAVTLLASATGDEARQVIAEAAERRDVDCGTGSCLLAKDQFVAAARLLTGESRTVEEALKAARQPTPDLSSTPTGQAAAAAPGGSSQPAPSFDCQAARSTTEKLICADSELARMDRELAVLYQAARQSAKDPQEFARASAAEWRIRERSCQDRACLVEWYEKRKVQLAAAGPAAQPPAAPPMPPIPVTNTPAAMLAASNSRLLGAWWCKYGDLVLADTGALVKFNADSSISRQMGIVNVQFSPGGQVVLTYDDNTGWKGAWSEQEFGDGSKNAYRTKWNGAQFWAIPAALKGFPVVEGKVFGGSLLCGRTK